LEFAYALEREMFFLHTGLKFKESLSKARFKTIWNRAVQLKSENLFAEIVARGEVEPKDKLTAISLIGDYGARTLLFYSELEAVQAQRRRMAETYLEKKRFYAGSKLLEGVVGALAASGLALQAADTDWVKSITILDEVFKAPDWMYELVANVQDRCAQSNIVDVHPATYVSKFGSVCARLVTKLQAGALKKVPIWDVAAELSFVRPQIGEPLKVLPGMSDALVTWKLPDSSYSASQDRFLGCYASLFEKPFDVPFPSWSAVMWLGRDHSEIHRAPLVALDKLDHMERAFRVSEPPKSVVSDPRFCSCPRRYFWREEAKLDSLWYNWPIIPGKFSTYSECADSYSRFSLEHRSHKDPVCFRASIFAAVLASWCKEYQFVIDYRVGARINTDMEIFSKIHYHSAKRIRLLELMCITQFLPGAHNVMISDACVELGTRRGPAFQFYDNQVSIWKARADLAKRLQMEADDPKFRQMAPFKRGVHRELKSK